MTKKRKCQYCGKPINEPAYSCEECMDDTGTMYQGPVRLDDRYDWTRAKPDADLWHYEGFLAGKTVSEKHLNMSKLEQIENLLSDWKASENTAKQADVPSMAEIFNAGVTALESALAILKKPSNKVNPPEPLPSATDIPGLVFGLKPGDYDALTKMFKGNSNK